jgi:predicted CxxxxCH...CXXCH cytochrome family protein
MYGTACACNATYCHSNGQGGAGALGTITWNSGATAACNSCHGNEANAATLSGTHNDHINGTQGGNFKCKDCHATVITNADNRTLADKSKHVNKLINYSGALAGKNRNCSNIYCHSNGKGTFVNPPVWSSATDLGCNGCHGTGNAFGRPDNGTPNSHAAHAVSGADCFKCHRLTASTTAGALVAGNVDHLDRTIDARLTKVNALVNYSGVYNTNKTCSATYCHGGSVTTVAWGTAGPLACNACHASNNTLPGAHAIHVNATVPTSYLTAAGNTSTTTVYNFTCASCHGNTAANHANGSVALNSDATIFFGFSSAGRNPAYTRTGTVGTDAQGFKWMYGAAGACNTTYCHSNGQGGNGALGTMTWNSGATAACNSCHGNEANAATLSGAHSDHVAAAAAGGNFKCSACHAQVITNADNRTLADKSKHVNKLMNYSGQFAGKNRTCSNIYCHSNGKGTFVNPPVWSSATNLDCNGCHGAAGAPLSATYAHTDHIAKGAGCAHCHSTTTTDGATISGTAHIDGTVTLVASGTFGTPAKAVSFSPAAGGTCNNISCHSPAATGPYVNSATWGVAATCETCHPKANLSGAHGVHMGALNLTSSSILYNMTANRTPASAQVSETVRQHGFGCANCHPMNTVNHLNGSIDVDLNRVNVAGVGTLRFLNASSASYDMASTKRCDNLYCHSNASRIDSESNVKANTSLAWNTTFAAQGGDRCAYCHGNQPTTGAHAAHSVGIHTFNDGSMLDGNIYNGKSGKLPIINRANTAHGNANNSTTIGCYICHNVTVTSKANDKNTRCVGCHYTGNSRGALLKGNAAIANLNAHVNGVRNVDFPAIKVISKAQVRPRNATTTAANGFDFYSGVWQRTSYKNMSTLSYDTAKMALNTGTMWHSSTPMNSNCTNIACHNGRTVAWNLANFNDPNKCMDCHNAL